MKQIVKTLSLSSMALLLFACGENNTDETTEETNEVMTEDEVTDDENTENIEDEAETSNEDEEETNEAENDTTSDFEEEIVAEDPLADYATEEIEYARVWLEVQGFTDMEQLNVQFIEAGTPVHPQIEEITEMDAPVYPEDVIQLTGNAGAHGMVTYSGNGDGTINVYNIPYRLPYPEDENWEELIELYEEWIKNPELVQVNVHEDEDVIELIEKIHYSD